jgi:hypothetical protein
MTGDLSGAVDGDTLSLVLTDTGFGGVWLARMAVAIIILGVLAVRRATNIRRPDKLLAALSAVLAASLAGVGHTQVEDGLGHSCHCGWCASARCRCVARSLPATAVPGCDRSATRGSQSSRQCLAAVFRRWSARRRNAYRRGSVQQLVFGWLL